VSRAEQSRAEGHKQERSREGKRMEEERRSSSNRREDEEKGGREEVTCRLQEDEQQIN
jgi:hypothetical protein